MMAWAAFWGFCSIAVVCSCIYRIVYVLTMREAPPSESGWEVKHDRA